MKISLRFNQMQTKMYDRDLIRRKLEYDRDIIRCKLRYNRDKIMNEINQRLESLREVMRRERLSAFISQVQTLIRANMWPIIGRVGLGFPDSTALPERRWLR